MDNLNQITHSGPSITDYDKYNTPTEKPHDNVMYLRDVLYKLKFSRPTLYRKIKEGEVPAPVEKINRRSAWRKDQVEEAYDRIFGKFK